MTTRAESILAPTVGSGDNRAPELLGAAGASDANAAALTVGQYATLLNSSDTKLSVRWGSSAPTAITTDLELAEGQRFDWEVQSATSWVAVIDPALGTPRAWVWQSSEL